MSPTTMTLGALRVAAVAGPARVRAQVQPGNELTRALDVAVRVMAAANDRMSAALAGTDLAGYERASLSYDAAEQRYDELCAAACEAGYSLLLAADKPMKVRRFTRRERFVRRLVARLRPLAAH